MMCPENVDFWLRAQTYRNSWCGDTAMTAALKAARRDEAYYESLIMICRDAHDVREAAANDIVNTYIHEDAPAQINIPATMREAIKAQVEEGQFPATLFDVAAKEVFKLLGDTFRDYQKCDKSVHPAYVVFAEKIEGKALEVSSPGPDLRDRASNSTF